MIFVPPHFMDADHGPAAGILEYLSILPAVELVFGVTLSSCIDAALKYANIGSDMKERA